MAKCDSKSREMAFSGRVTIFETSKQPRIPGMTWKEIKRNLLNLQFADTTSSIRESDEFYSCYSWPERGFAYRHFAKKTKLAVFVLSNF